MAGSRGWEPSARRCGRASPPWFPLVCDAPHPCSGPASSVDLCWWPLQRCRSRGLCAFDLRSRPSGAPRNYERPRSAVNGRPRPSSRSGWKADRQTVRMSWPRAPPSGRGASSESAADALVVRSRDKSVARSATLDASSEPGAADGKPGRHGSLLCRCGTRGPPSLRWTCGGWPTEPAP
jgi:hypothetical protein